MDLRALDDPNARYSLAETTTLWRLAVEATGDRAFGLRVASAVTPGTFQALSYSLIASSTLRDAMERVVRYFRVATDAAEPVLQSRGDAFHLLIEHPPGPRPAHEAVDAFVSLLVRTCRALAGSSLRPVRIDFARPRPADPAPFERVLRAPLLFDASVTQIIWSAAEFLRPLEGANPELARHNDAIAIRHLARLTADNLRVRIEAALVERLPHGAPSQDEVAVALHLSTRSLQRRLAEHGTTYTEVLDSTRRALAADYIADRSYSVSEITYVLGFSDTNSFVRAFKRWTGKAPTEFRRDVLRE